MPLFYIDRTRFVEMRRGHDMKKAPVETGAFPNPNN